MKIGEFARKLKSAINEEGYTSNNVELVDISYKLGLWVITCEGNNGSEFDIYIDEN